LSPVSALNRGFAGALLAGVVVAAPAFAAVTPNITIGNAVFTGRNEDVPDREKTHQEIFNLLYGGGFQPVGLDYSNGQYYMQRIPDDLLPGQPQTAIGLAAPSLYDYTDQVWSDQFGHVEAHYRFANYSPSFGYAPLDRNGPALASTTPPYDDLIDITWQHWGPNYQPIGMTAQMPDLNGAEFVWARGKENGLFYSDPSLNRDGKDHLITYKVIPIEQGTERLAVNGNFTRSFLLFWEDQIEGQNAYNWGTTDYDFNDLVVEVEATYTHVPEPSALALAGIAATALLRRRRIA
jgi:hypothetical protein